MSRTNTLLNGIEANPALIKFVGEGKLGAAAQDILNRKISLPVKCLCWIFVVLSFGIAYLVTKKRTDATMAVGGATYAAIRQQTRKAMKNDSTFMHFAEPKLMLLADEIFEPLPAGQGVKSNQGDPNCPETNVPSKFFQETLKGNGGFSRCGKLFREFDELLPGYSKRNHRQPADIIGHKLFVRTITRHRLKLMAKFDFPMKAGANEANCVTFLLLFIAVSSDSFTAHLNSDCGLDEERSDVHDKFIDNDADNPAYLFRKVEVDKFANDLFSIAEIKKDDALPLKDILYNSNWDLSVEDCRCLVTANLDIGAQYALHLKQTNETGKEKISGDTSVGQFTGMIPSSRLCNFRIFANGAQCNDDTKLSDVGVDIDAARAFVDKISEIRDIGYRLASPGNLTDDQRKALAKIYWKAKANRDREISKVQTIAVAARKLLAAMSSR
ncbi:MAG: hypothetical protein LBI39_03705 [Puniceicoccales bacterium]|nr:hypothetical protein [Puniceicoccales bacterium]